jgi:hypothetical protein
MNIKERYAYINVLIKQYRRASKKDRSKILDELVKNTGYNRDFGALLLRTNAQLKKNRKRNKPSQYFKIIELLKELWVVSNFLCAKRIQPFLPELLQVLEEKGELRVTGEQRGLLRKISSATVDRLLRPIRQQVFGKGKSATRPGTLLKHKIPVHTFAEWDDEAPGFLEMDVVAHCGDSLRGEYINSLDAVDIATYQVECESFMGRSQRFVTEALDIIIGRLPFPLLGIDCDKLVSFGLAKERNFSKKVSVYEPIISKGHHDHLICQVCGSVIEFENDGIEKLQNRITNEHSFNIVSHRLEIFGICKDCK